MHLDPPARMKINSNVLIVGVVLVTGVIIAYREEALVHISSERIRAEHPDGTPPAPIPVHVTVDNFKFENYTLIPKTLDDHLNVLFPIGTPKAFIDKILVEKNGANCPDCANPKNPYAISNAFVVVHYYKKFIPVAGDTVSCRNEPELYVTVDYDKDLKLMSLKAGRVASCF